MRAIVVLGLLVSAARADPTSPGSASRGSAGTEQLKPEGRARTDSIEVADARALLPAAPASCTDIPCMLEHAYAEDTAAKASALALYRELGDVAGVGPDEIMDGGYRGKIHLVPELPKGKYRQHLAWVLAARRSTDAFFAALFADRPAPSYRWRALALRFVRSVDKRTPSAYAFGWVIEYNVAGSLMTSEAGVRETLFHELFHDNDGDHNDWSARTLQRDYDAIVKKCGTKIRCLDPYAPNSTKVRGGTYYAFQQNNGNAVHEYAAELAIRYWKEQTQMLRDNRLARPAFKCGPPENARAWQAIVDEFFGGRDLVPACE